MWCPPLTCFIHSKLSYLFFFIKPCFLHKYYALFCILLYLINKYDFILQEQSMLEMLIRWKWLRRYRSAVRTMRMNPQLNSQELLCAYNDQVNMSVCRISILEFKILINCLDGRGEQETGGVGLNSILIFCF